MFTYVKAGIQHKLSTLKTRSKLFLEDKNDCIKVRAYGDALKAILQSDQVSSMEHSFKWALITGLF